MQPQSSWSPDALSIAARQRWRVLVLLGLAVVARPVDAQLSARQARVEVVIPKLPEPVVVATQRVLVYELHVTNFGRGPLDFHAIDVFDDAVPATSIAAYRDSALDAVLQPVGSMGRMDATGSMMRDATTRAPRSRNTDGRVPLARVPATRRGPARPAASTGVR